MASLPYKSFIGSPPFTFLVGPDRKEFSIHSNLVANQSTSLDTLINGEMMEAEERCVTWEETDEETFILFSEFVYTGGYDAIELHDIGAEPLSTIPESSISGNEEVVMYTDREPEPEPDLDSWGRRSTNKKDRKAAPIPVKTHSEILRDRFQSLHITKSTYSKLLGYSSRGELFAHAKLYVFADYHGIAALQTLCLQNLKSSLNRFVLDKKSVRAIVDLIVYSFENTPSRKQFGDCEPLRYLLTVYAASEKETMWKREGFRRIIETQGEFARAFTGQLIE